jgi:hypothetical protein
MALLARFACGCAVRVEIPAPEEVVCAEHGTRARLTATARGQVRYVPLAPAPGSAEATHGGVARPAGAEGLPEPPPPGRGASATGSSC